MMLLNIKEARELAQDSMAAMGHTAAEAEAIADHLIDCELRGMPYGGLARAVSITEHMRSMERPCRPITVLRESAATAQLDGGNQVGYLVARKATETAITKARRSGIGAVGASKTWYTGMFSYYLEMVTRAGFVGMIAGSGPPLVAPYGGVERRFCTNPIAFGFPGEGTPVIWDIGTSAVTFAEVMLRQRLGKPLPEGLAFDAHGEPTTDPASALQGALAVWGGARGSGLALSIQLLGMLAGQVNSDVLLPDCGFFIVVIDPGLFGEPGDFARQVSGYAATIRDTHPVNAGTPVRVPFERSVAERRRRLEEGTIEVADLVVEKLRQVCRAGS